ncbi:MAG TPA: alpha/beta fold hydrolase [Gemmatimonadaceae bacterium]|nr:alpha/beta fold hydrolase [Gemmatimonadaceae bacterium]
MPSASQWRKVAGVLAGVAAALWMVGRVANVRSATGRISVDTGCQSDPSTIAAMRGLAPSATRDAGPIRCEAWDIGTGVTGYVWHARNPRAVLLLQTGWGDYAQRYVNQGSRLIPHLLDRGISVYAFDMWGSGRSPGKRGATHVGAWVADHRTARRKLRDQPLPVFVLGHSVGGLVTVTSVLGDQTALHGMILLAPTLDWGLSGFMRLVARAGAFVVPTLPVPGTGGWDDVTRAPEAQRRLNADPLMYHGGLSWVTAGSGVTLSRENWARYRELRVPVLVLHGGADRAPDPSGSREFVALVTSPDKTLSIIEGGLHALLDDTAGPEVLQKILTWLDQRVPTASTSR